MDCNSPKVVRDGETASAFRQLAFKLLKQCSFRFDSGLSRLVSITWHL
jgi:hypothetical protein